MVSLLSLICETLTLFSFIILFGITITLLIIRPQGENMVAFIPLYFVIGLASLINVYFLLAFFIFTRLVVLISITICLGILLALLLFSYRRENIKLLNINKNFMLQTLIISSLIILSFMIFLRLTYVFWMHTFFINSDPIYFGMQAALILFYKKFPTTWEPIIKHKFNVWSYPIGFALLTALTSLINSTPPVKSMLILSSLIIAMIPPLFYTMVYLRTKSTLLSLVAFLIPFITPIDKIPPLGVSYNLLLSSCISDLYPFMLGNFLTFGIIALLHYEEVDTRRRWALLGILLPALFIAYYPSFLVLMLILYFAYVFYEKSIYKKVATITGGILSYYFLILLRNRGTRYISIKTEFLSWTHKKYMELLLDKRLEYYIPVMIMGSIASLYLLNKRKQAQDTLPVSTITLTGLQLFSLNRYVFTKFLWLYIFPWRFIIVCVLLSFICVLYYYHYSINCNSRYNMKKLKSSYLTFCLIMILVLSSSLRIFMQYEPDNKIPSLSPRGGMYEGLKWVATNVESDAVILNDPSTYGLLLPTFSPHKVVNVRGYRTGLEGANQIFQEPYNHTFVLHIMKKYNIKYILVTNVPSEKRKTSLTFDVYLKCFNSNPHLLLVFNNSACALYRINDELS